jgi:hypothetical protein
MPITPPGLRAWGSWYKEMFCRARARNRNRFGTSLEFDDVSAYLVKLIDLGNYVGKSYEVLIKSV